jgi:hypothetical protein
MNLTMNLLYCSWHLGKFISSFLVNRAANHPLCLEVVYLLLLCLGLVWESEVRQP